jgi:hypothetical protein
VASHSASERTIALRQVPVDAILAGAFALLGLLLRLPLLGRGLWRDEGSTYADIATNSIGTVLHHVWTNEMTPPFYFLVEYVWTRLAGTSEAMLRAPSLVFSLITIIVAYMLGRRVAGRVGAIVCAFCATCSPLVIELGAEARAYTLAILLCTVFLLAYASSLMAGRVSRAWLAVLVASGVLLVATYNTAVVVVGIVALFSIAAAVVKRNEKNTALAIGAILTCLLSLLLLPYLTHVVGGWRGCCPREGDLNTQIDTALNAFSPLGAMNYQGNVLLKIGVIAWLLGLLRRKAEAQDALTAVSAAIVGAGIAAGIILNISPERHLMLYAPAFWLLVTLLCYRFQVWLGQVRSWRWIALAPIAYTFVAGVIYYPHVYAREMQRLSGMRNLATALERFKGTPILLVVAPDYDGPALYYYVHADPSILLRGIATWDEPQFYAIDPKLWQAADFVRAEEDRIERLAQSRHALIALAVDTRAHFYDGVPFDRAILVVSALEKNRPVLYDHVFPGERESVDLVVLRPYIAEGTTRRTSRSTFSHLPEKLRS